MKGLHYIGLDVHKKTISDVIKTYAGELVDRGQVAASRPALTRWAQQLPRPWVGALEATMFTGWVYDCLRPLAERLEVAHPVMLKAITCAKKKNDSLDAEKIGDLLRCDLLPRCYMAPSEIRELRRITKSDLKVHLVWIPKYRKKVSVGPLAIRVRDLIRQIAIEHELHIISGKVARDHVHVFLSYRPHQDVSTIVQWLKGISSRVLLQEFPHLRKQFWNPQCRRITVAVHALQKVQSEQRPLDQGV